MTKLHRRQVLWPDGLAQWAEIIVGYRRVAAGIFRRTSIADHGAARRIEAGVISDVAKVALVADAVAAADTVTAIAEDVISKAEARRQGSPAGLPETVRCTLVCDLDLSAPDLRLEAAARTEVEVGVETGVVVVLHAVVFVAETHIESQPRRHLVAILSIPGPILVAIAARKGCFGKGRLDSAGGVVNDIAKVAVGGRGVDGTR